MIAIVAITFTFVFIDIAIIALLVSVFIAYHVLLVLMFVLSTDCFCTGPADSLVMGFIVSCGQIACEIAIRTLTRHQLVGQIWVQASRIRTYCVQFYWARKYCARFYWDRKTVAL